MIMAITVLGHLYIPVCGPGALGLRPQAWLLSHPGSWPRTVFLEASLCDPDMPGMTGVFGPKAADKPKHDETHGRNHLPMEVRIRPVCESPWPRAVVGVTQRSSVRRWRARGLPLSVRSGEQCSEGPGLPENDGAI